MHLILACVAVVLLGSSARFASGQGESQNCGKEHKGKQITFEECEQLYAGQGACLPPANCPNNVCQKKCYECNCADKEQCKVTGTGKNEKVECDCTLGTNGTGYGPFCNSDCDETGGCVQNNSVCDLDTYTCECEHGYELNSVGECEDINECYETPCPSVATCQNTPGGFICICPSGQEYDAETNTCVAPLNECEATPNICGPNADCIDTVGSYVCVCRLGYTLVNGVCVDINECEEGTSGCDVNAYCTNLPGSWRCDCNPGWIGDGFVCVDVDECQYGINGGCGSNAICVNTPGSFMCRCFNTGYQWSGMTCEDVDECATNNGNCANGFCINTIGSYLCMCQCGYSWNGAFCAANCNGCGH